MHRDYNAAINILSRGLFGKTTKPFRPVSEFSKKYKARRGIGQSHAGPKPAPKSRAKVGPTPAQSKTGRKKNTLIKRDERKNSILTKQGKRTPKDRTVSRAYKSPSLWRLLGRNYSPGMGQVAQAQAGGMYPHVVPSHLHPLERVS